MEEQQKILLEQVRRLQQRIDGGAATDVSIAGQPTVPSTTSDTSTLAAKAALNTQAAHLASTSAQPASGAEPPSSGGRFRDGMIIWQTSADVKIPFLLKFNDDTQFRYLNTLLSDETFTDHLGVVREVHKRNDFTVNRQMFVFSGYVFDERLGYSLKVWTSMRRRATLRAS